MDMSAHLLTCLGCAKSSYHRYLRRILAIRRSSFAAENRIKICWRGLVIVDAVQAEAECLHDDTGRSMKVADDKRSHMALNTAIQY
jgi:hypothetical protein